MFVSVSYFSLGLVVVKVSRIPKQRVTVNYYECLGKQ